MTSENILLTFGQGVKAPKGSRAQIPRTVEAIVDAINRHRGPEAWWSAHTWADDYRTKESWERCGALIIDIDYHEGLDNRGRPGKHVEAPERAAIAFLERLAGPWAGQWSLAHCSPRGARIGWLLDQDLADEGPKRAPVIEAHVLASKIAGKIVEGLAFAADESGIGGGLYVVDEKASLDLARLYFTPYAKNRKPLLGIHAGRAAPFSLVELDALAASVGADRTGRRKGRPTKVEMVTRAAVKTAFADDANDLAIVEALEKRPAEGGHDGSLELIQTARAAIALGVKDGESFAAMAQAWNAKRTVPWAAEELVKRFEDAKERWDGEGLAGGVPAGRYTRPGLSKILSEDREFAQRFTYNVLEQTTYFAPIPSSGLEALPLDGPGTAPGPHGAPLTEELLVRVEQAVCARYGWPQVPKDALWGGIAAEAKLRTIDPVRAFLGALPAWDGVDRLGGVGPGLVDALRVTTPGRALAAAYLRKALIAAVARAIQPGCKVDNVPILVGPDRALKSTVIRTLAGPWYGDGPLEIEGKDGLMRIRGTWIFEWSEIDGVVRRSDVARMKSFLTTQTDAYRAPYERVVSTVPRRTVFWGTSNSEALIYDNTSNRRFWILEIDRGLDLDWVTACREQLWAEALQRYATGEPWWLDDAEEEAREEANEAFVAPNLIEENVDKALEALAKKPGFDGMINAAEFFAALGLETGHKTSQEMARYGYELKKRGFKRVRFYNGTTRQRGWKK